MSYNKWKWITRVIGTVGALLIVIGNNDNNMGIFKYIGFILLVIAIIIAIITLRCPNCQGTIPDALNIKFSKCPHCGYDLKNKT